MKDASISDESGIVYIPKFREYGVKVLDGGTSFLEINYCPWCGNKLPESLRDEWFEILDSLDIDPAADEIPEKFLNDHWYSENP
jgi:hypothetical protein